MATIEFENGMKVQFEGNPTPQDVEEVAQQIGINTQAPKKEGVRFGKALPAAGSVLGGVAGGIVGGLVTSPTILGIPAGVAAGGVIGAGLGASAGEGLRQSVSQIAGAPVQKPLEEAQKEFKRGAIGEAIGLGVAAPIGAGLRALGGQAPRLYQAALKPTEKLLNRGVVESGLEEGIVVGKKGLSTVQKNLKTINNEIADVIEQAGKNNVPIQTERVLKRLDEVKKFYGETVLGDDLISQIDDVAEKFSKRQGKTITVQQAQKLKQNTNVLLGKLYGQISTATGEATKNIVRGLKEEIAAQVPEVAKLNARDSSLISLEKALSNAVKREGNKLPVGLLPTIAATGGLATGGPVRSVMAGVLAKTLQSPRVLSTLAIALKKAGSKTTPQSVIQSANLLYNMLNRFSNP